MTKALGETPCTAEGLDQLVGRLAVFGQPGEIISGTTNRATRPVSYLYQLDPPRIFQVVRTDRPNVTATLTFIQAGIDGEPAIAHARHTSELPDESAAAFSAVITETCSRLKSPEYEAAHAAFFGQVACNIGEFVPHRAS